MPLTRTFDGRPWWEGKHDFNDSLWTAFDCKPLPPPGTPGILWDFDGDFYALVVVTGNRRMIRPYGSYTHVIEVKAAVETPFRYLETDDAPV